MGSSGTTANPKITTTGTMAVSKAPPPPRRTAETTLCKNNRMSLSIKSALKSASNASKNGEASAADTASTLYFPISGNPIGFNHLAIAEWMLRCNEGLRQVVFILSNGHHPDPTKPDPTVDTQTRWQMLGLAINSVADAQTCYLAALAQAHDDQLRLNAASLAASDLEFTFKRAVRTAELIPLLKPAEKETGADAPSRLNWLAGSDLVQRMANPDIFSDADLALLSSTLTYHIIERPTQHVQAALNTLRESRGIQLMASIHPLGQMPTWLGRFLSLSSSAIRQAAQAGDPLEGLLPSPAAAVIKEQGLYRKDAYPQYSAETNMKSPPESLALENKWAALQQELAREAQALHKVFLQRRDAGLPHTLSLVETSSGGLITAALAGISGASGYFRQSRFAYDSHAKSSLLGSPLQGSSVSEAAVTQLARAMRQAAQTDFSLAESGMAGPPDGKRRSGKSGVCCLAMVETDEQGQETAHAETVEFAPFATRKEHQLRFALHALKMMKTRLEGL